MSDQYKYIAVSDDGVREEGVITAGGANQVEEYLDKLDLRPVSIDRVRRSRTLSLLGFLRRTDYEQLIMFTNSLATMYRAGIPILRALSFIRVGKSDSRFNQIVRQIRLQVQSGRSLSQAMEDYPRTFSKVYTASVHAGEETGRLDATLHELSEMLEHEMELNRQIMSAVRYPLIVIAAICLAFFVLMNFVIPRFVDFYSSFGAELPWATRTIIGMSNFVSTYWPLLLGLTIVGLLGFRKYISTAEGRAWHDRQLTRLPVLGDLIVKGNVARFCLMFRILFKSGLPLIRALTILGATIKNTAIAGEIKQMEEYFQRGKGLDRLVGEFKLMPEQALHMIAIGLESGNLDDMLGEIGDFYSRQVLYTSRHLTAIIEPILTLVLGAFVLILALAIFLPMWNLIKVFGQ